MYAPAERTSRTRQFTCKIRQTSSTGCVGELHFILDEQIWAHERDMRGSRQDWKRFDSPVAFPASCIAVATPAWLNDRDQIDYATTKKGEPFKNASEVVSRKSVAALVVTVWEFTKPRKGRSQ
jgi:hypothetical protein